MKLYLLKYGEIALKGKNRRFFEKQLIDNLKVRLQGISFELIKKEGRIYIKSDHPRVLQRLQDTFGLVEIAQARLGDLSLPVAETLILEEMEKLDLEEGTSFKVNTRRSNKGFPMQSPEVSSHLGGFLLDHYPHLRVDVHKPDITLEVEIREKIYVYSQRHRALGGMPYGVSGKAVQLMSGGIDSPVAAWLMAKRGVRILFLHFHAAPLTSEMALQKVRDLIVRLSEYMGPLDFYHINLLPAQQKIREVCDERYFTILQRRMMTRLAEKLAFECGALGLSTGENIAQVASQTLEGMRCTSDVSSLPIYRPLITYDKEEIVLLAKKIGTFDISILPFEDCCTVFLPKQVVTLPKLADVQAQEEKLNIEELMEISWKSMLHEILGT